MNFIKKNIYSENILCDYFFFKEFLGVGEIIFLSDFSPSEKFFEFCSKIFTEKFGKIVFFFALSRF